MVSRVVGLRKAELHLLWGAGAMSSASAIVQLSWGLEEFVDIEMSGKGSSSLALKSQRQAAGVGWTCNLHGERRLREILRERGIPIDDECVEERLEDEVEGMSVMDGRAVVGGSVAAGEECVTADGKMERSDETVETADEKIGAADVVNVEAGTANVEVVTRIEVVVEVDVGKDWRLRGDLGWNLLVELEASIATLSL